MPLFTIEIAGEPILVFPEESLALAQEEAKTGNVTGALQEFERDGEPVWDGATALVVREASTDEQDQYEHGFSEAAADGEIGEADRDEFAVFLIETDDDEDDDEEFEDEDGDAEHEAEPESDKGHKA